MFEVKRVSVGIAAMLFGVGGAAAASGSPAVDLTSPGELYASNPYTLGFEFSVDSPTSITALGVFDDGVALPADSQVGLWDTSGDLLTSVTVPASGSTQLGYFAYASISHYALTPGTDYIIGSYDPAITGTASSLNTDQGGAGSYAGYLTVIQDQYSDNSAFSFPDTTDGYSGGAWLGANFLAGVPEPATWAFMLAGVGLIGAGLRRRELSAAV
jgi:hypothetical protein